MRLNWKCSWSGPIRSDILGRIIGLDFLRRIKTLSPKLKVLVIDIYARVLSMRDIEESLEDEE